MATIDPLTASRLIGERLTCLPIESLPVGHCVGAVLRENVYAERDQPPFDRVAVTALARRRCARERVAPIADQSARPGKAARKAGN